MASSLLARVQRSVALAAVLAVAPLSASAQTTGAALIGVVTSQAGAIRLPGALVTVSDSDGTAVTEQITGADGAFRIPPLQPGMYIVTASLQGFRTVQRSVTVVGAAELTVDLDLPLADISEQVDVVATRSGLPRGDTLAPASTVESRELEVYAPGGGIQSALRLLASAIETRTGVSIKGGRTDQASAQLGSGTMIDPSTGLVPLTLPADAVESVQVLPNPYAVEFGRFSSGVVVVETRRAGDAWTFRLNDVDPDFRTSRENNAKIIGLHEFAPRVAFGGPIVPHRLFIEQTGQFRYVTTDVPSRPETELQVERWLSTLTRVDANVDERQSLVVTGGLFRRTATDATLGTFVPPAATVNLRDHISHATASARSVWNTSLVTESMFRIQEETTADEPQGSAPMILQPETTLGNFFNRQNRVTTAFQWVNTATVARTGPGGLHLIKAGIDLLHSRYDGDSTSVPVLVTREDGTLARRIDFTGPSTQLEHSTDVALFAQDRVQPFSRWYAEVGARLDRDGVLAEWNATPRAGVAVLLTGDGRAVLRGGYGLFFERTPSAAGVFGAFDQRIETRFAADGTTIVAGPTRLAHAIAPDLETPRSATWNVSYDHRLSAAWSVHAGVLARRSSRELIVRPELDAVGGRLLLTSTGRSEYREAEAGVEFRQVPGLDLQATYVRSLSRADLNSFTTLFGAVRQPIIGANEYAPTSADVPNRVLVRARYQTPRWLFLTITDWHTGFPYSTVDEMLDYVGPRNARRFPDQLRVEVGVERRFRALWWRPWIGVRVNNALNRFLPADVQANVGSPAFGTFYNSEYRRIRLIIRFEK